MQSQNTDAHFGEYGAVSSLAAARLRRRNHLQKQTAQSSAFHERFDRETHRRFELELQTAAMKILSNSIVEERETS
jgi:hypothetical protein